MMIDLGQHRPNKEQEITALFLKYLPFEPLPVDLTSRLKARVLMEVKSSLKRRPLSITSRMIAIVQKIVKYILHWQFVIGVIAGILWLTLLIVIYFDDLLALIFS